VKIEDGVAGVRKYLAEWKILWRSKQDRKKSVSSDATNMGWFDSQYSVQTR